MKELNIGPARRGAGGRSSCDAVRKNGLQLRHNWNISFALVAIKFYFACESEFGFLCRSLARSPEHLSVRRTWCGRCVAVAVAFNFIRSHSSHSVHCCCCLFRVILFVLRLFFCSLAQLKWAIYSRSVRFYCVADHFCCHSFSARASPVSSHRRPSKSCVCVCVRALGL